ncbi:uncharacterized protein LOC116292737 [Actinia tenebrosa]|uniref:Uncharacterized protein LOC116292737 n=1 Tax=Actinia tenebrosa TaxID=6105 RepID=A0A6P8HHU8_ACTTE|nr:uncharacterized protein LOC116292737 [Actinia tenebrosa]
MQFVFLGNTGFRFPFAHFPTREADPASIYVNFWKAVGWLDLYGFNATFCCCDGGQANRSFIQMHFKGKDAIEDNFTTVNPYTRKPMVFILDPSYNFKKIRNNLEKSRIGGVRLLTVGCDHIEWAHLYQAYRWDQNSNSLKIHEELTEDHFNLGYATRMRNHLAEQVLSKKMLYLLQSYRKHV